MKLIIISIIIMSSILLISIIILFVFLLELRNKRSNIRKIKYYSVKQNLDNINIINFNNVNVSNDHFTKHKEVEEMLKYLQVKDNVNYNNVVSSVSNILEKPIQYNLQNNKNGSYFLTNIIDILCHHHCAVNRLHLIGYLFNKCHNQWCQQQNFNNKYKTNSDIKLTHAFNKIQINDLTPKNNLLISKKCNHYSAK